MHGLPAEFSENLPKSVQNYQWGTDGQQTEGQTDREHDDLISLTFLK
jgi:hypothetical protein